MPGGDVAANPDFFSAAEKKCQLIMRKEIRFKATIPPVQSALKFGGKIGRVTFEIPESEISKAVGLIALQETPLEVVIRVDESQGQETSRPEGEGVRGKELRKNFAF